MSDFDLNSILSSLSNDDINNLKNIANSILGDDKKENSQKDNSNETTNNSNIPNLDLSSLGLPDMSQFSNLLPLLSALNTHDSREDFLFALKPLLSKERQKKTDEAMKFIKLLSLIPLLKEKGLM